MLCHDVEFCCIMMLNYVVSDVTARQIRRHAQYGRKCRYRCVFSRLWICRASWKAEQMPKTRPWSWQDCDADHTIPGRLLVGHTILPPWESYVMLCTISIHFSSLHLGFQLCSGADHPIVSATTAKGFSISKTSQIRNNIYCNTNQHYLVTT